MRIVFVDPGFGNRSWNTFGQSHWTSIIHQGLCGLSACCKEAGYQDVDIYEAKGELVLKAELPGIQKEDVSVEVKDNVLTLKGERFPEPKIDAENYYRQEICFGTFERSFTLQERIQPDLIKATFKDGVLKVKIPRPQIEKPKQINVEVE